MNKDSKEFIKQMKLHGYTNTKRYLDEAKGYAEYSQDQVCKRLALAYLKYRKVLK